MVGAITVVGGGSAGFIAAITLKQKIPHLEVTVVRSTEIPTIGVGEGSTAAFTRYLHDYLKINVKKFFSVARPTFKLGLRFLWGPRPYFNYTFAPMVDTRLDEKFPSTIGSYIDEAMEHEDPYSSLMTFDKAFEQGPAGPKPHRALAYHFENRRFVEYLEGFAAALGVVIIDDTVEGVLDGPAGIAALRLASGASLSADLYVDCSGFRSMLLGNALGEPLVSYRSSLYCDRACVGGWERGEEVIKPYTTCETMHAGWCWQIEHEERINRGYVYASSFISDEQAETEFRHANPRVTSTRIIRFDSGRRRRNWVKNVVAIGNAAGFVEPLEATALGVHALQSRDMVQTLIESGLDPQPTQIAANNAIHAHRWDSVRKFLAVHYKFNTRLETPFWRAARADTDLAGAEPIVEYFRENGPAPYWGGAFFPLEDQFRYSGYCVLLLGQKVPFRRWRDIPSFELNAWELRRHANCQAAERGVGVLEALQAVRAGKLQW